MKIREMKRALRRAGMGWWQRRKAVRIARRESK